MAVPACLNVPLRHCLPSSLPAHVHAMELIQGENRGHGPGIPGQAAAGES